MSERYFHRGKEARARGLPREVRDARVSLENRQQFFAGWDDQDRNMRPALTPEQNAECDESLAMARAFLNSQGFQSKRNSDPQ